MSDSLLNLEDYFRHVGARMECPFCGSLEWDAEVIQNEWIVTRLTGRTADTDWQDRPVMTLTCARCGYLRLQDFRPILAWIKTQERVS